MHNHATFSDFSALQTTLAATPAASDATERSPERDTGGTGAAQGHNMAPPFSWLGGDAWPNFPARADTAP